MWPGSYLHQASVTQVLSALFPRDVHQSTEDCSAVSTPRDSWAEGGAVGVHHWRRTTASEV